MEISTDMQKVKDSKCFGIAWDGDVKECKLCEVASVCKQRTLGGVKQAPSKPATKKVDSDSEKVSTMKPANPRPEPKKSDNENKTEKTAKKSAKEKTKDEVTYNSDMPDFKPMSIEDLVELAKERGLNPADFDKYTHTNIKKMRLTMALKKTYESK